MFITSSFFEMCIYFYPSSYVIEKQIEHLVFGKQKEDTKMFSGFKLRFNPLYIYYNCLRSLGTHSDTV